jgi:predicted amidohydrolase
MGGDPVRATLLQIDVDPRETVAERRARAAALVRRQAAADLVVLPELWPVGAFAADRFEAEAEPVDGGPTAELMSAAARDAGVWLHAGSVVERASGDSAAAGEGALYNTSLLFSPDGELHTAYRKIHRFGFDSGEAVLMAAGDTIVTARLPQTVLGLATCYDLRFPEQFRLLVDAGAQILVIPAGWPARRLAHWRVLVQARAVESQAYVLACGTAGTHAGVEQAGNSMVVDPWGEVIAEAGPGEQTLTAELDPVRVTATRADFPVLRDRVLGLPEPQRTA